MDCTEKARSLNVVSEMVVSEIAIFRQLRIIRLCCDQFNLNASS